ncbi:MAG: tRNA (adenosine(37)-N6)-dimethylallyltransferase MiaA [Patescibacteria group bacterium]|nr:tRNA (adenosine(37)-N6)-dimethylallyltransferase MiaA [Patescibacteria group bacterium]
MNPESKNVLVIVGPTASGKSDLAARLAKRLNGEVISADSRQVYRGLDIGTGKITKREMRGVRHHLLDVADPRVPANSRLSFTAVKYRTLARKAIDDILSRGKLPIVCGGTGFYIDAIFKDDDFPAVPADKKLRAELEKKSAAHLMAMLKRLDPPRARDMAANNSEKNNARRIIRAIEVSSFTRKDQMEDQRHGVGDERLALHKPSRHSSVPVLRYHYNPIFIGIKMPMDKLRSRIAKRLARRLRAGMLAEAARLHKAGLSWKRMEELGLEYRYMALHLRGRLSRQEFTAKLATAIGQYAKRQMTWFKRNKDIKWLNTKYKKSRPFKDRLDVKGLIKRVTQTLH